MFAQSCANDMLEFDDLRLGFEQFLAGRRLVEGQNVFQFLLTEIGRIGFGDCVGNLAEARLQICAHLRRDLVKVRGQARILLQEKKFGLLDHTGDKRIENRRRAGGGDQLLGHCNRRCRRLLGMSGRDQKDQGGGDRSGAGDTLNGLENAHFIAPSVSGLQGRSTILTPSGPATMAICARPMNSPCSMTPGMPESACAITRGSSIRSRAASIIQ